jgi:hypothetical protein
LCRQGGADRFDWRHRLWGVDDTADEEFQQGVLAAEEHFAFVGEVAEERPLGQSGALGDLGDRGLVESAFGVEIECRLLQATSSVGLPPAHK